MTSPSETPYGEHRHLRLALCRAREGRKLTQREVAEALEWSPSKLIRIEKGTVGISITDLKALLLHYRITDADKVNRLVEMARSSKKSAWWQEYSDHVSRQFLTFLGLEAAAIRIRQYQSLVVPGLLQSSGYIYELSTIGDPNEVVIRRYADIRARRQHIVGTENSPEMFFIIDESVLHRVIGSKTIMREQLVKLREMTASPQVSIQILPFSAGVHKGMKGSFELLEFSEEPDDYALLLEQVYKDQLIQIPSEETTEFVQFFTELEKIALPAGETPRMIDERLKQMEKEG